MPDNLHLYPVLVFWSPQDEEYICVAPDLPGHSAVGVTREQAVRGGRYAMQAWIMAQEAAGNPLPAPSSGEAMLTRIKGFT